MARTDPVTPAGATLQPKDMPTEQQPSSPSLGLIRSGPDGSGQAVGCIWSLFRAKPSILDPFRTKFDVLGPDPNFGQPVLDLGQSWPTLAALGPRLGPILGQPWADFEPTLGQLRADLWLTWGGLLNDFWPAFGSAQRIGTLTLQTQDLRTTA